MRSTQSLFLIALLSTFAALPAQGTPIGFEEQFALSTDRSKTLAQLIPGTEDHFFYSCLLAQHEGRFDEVPPLLRTWIERHGRTPRVYEIENRQALLLWERDPAATTRLIVERLGLSFSDQQRLRGAAPDLPTRLDQALIAPERLMQIALERHPGTVDGVRDTALHALATRRLDDSQLVSLLQRLSAPDVPNLPALVVRELRRPQSAGFGALRIHGLLTLDQLEQCAAQVPGLLNDPRFVDAYLPRLSPDADVDVARDAQARLRWLERLEAFATRLGAAHNSLKAHVLHQRLAFDLTRGNVDQDRLFAYLRLPRHAVWVNRDFVRRAGRADELVAEDRAFATGLPVIGGSEPLVRECLEHVLRDAGSYDAFAEFVDPVWLRRVFAETKILAGIGDMQRWYALLDDPAYYERLRDRVEISFPRTARTEFAATDPVAIDVDVKNAGTLIVKLFEIDTFNWLRATGREVDAAIELDGLVASEERTVRIDEPPLRRVRRTFEFPSIDRTGVWVVEFIGNGIASRAVLRKGALRAVEHPGVSGHLFTVLDESGAVARDATLWFQGNEYAADERGTIVVPYSTAPGHKTYILRRGAVSSLGRFVHRNEDYALSAAVFVERETLIPGARSKLLIRPTLTLCGEPLAPALLQEPVLTVSAIAPDGITSTQDVRGLTLAGDRETVHEIQVPERIARIVVALRGRITSLTTGQPIELASSERSFELNGIDATAQVDCPLLVSTASGWAIDVLGKNGEPRADRAVQVRLWHRDFTDPVDVTLKTDAKGRIELGGLDRIERVQSDGFPEENAGWHLPSSRRTTPARLHGASGETLRVALPAEVTVLDRSVASLFEVRGRGDEDLPVRDVSDRLALAAGQLELRGLVPGDYELRIVGQRPIEVRVTAGARAGTLAVGRDRVLALDDGARLHVTRIGVEGGELRIALAHAGSDARVHVVATRYAPAFDAFDSLLAPGGADPAVAWFDHAASSYHVGREIGEEYRYILERRFAPKFAGNMLTRPGLLLNPWALEPTVTAIGLGGGAGGKFGGRRGGSRSEGAGPARPHGGKAATTGVFPNLAFLPSPARVLPNLRPGADGIVRVPLADLGEGQHVHVAALDARGTERVSIALPERALQPRPRDLARALDPERRFAEQRKVEFVDAGGTLVVDDGRSAEVETFDTLADVHGLFRALSGNTDLDEFAFVLRWPELTAAEKREQYSKHACHELHFFLHQKDRAFFDAVVRPYLANKIQRTFLDDWLLDADLQRYVEPWAFARLNAFEQILLVQRLPGERAAIERLLRDAVDLVPPDPARDAKLFRSALASKQLAADADLGVLKDMRAQEFRARRSLAEPGAPADAPAAAAPAPTESETARRDRAGEAADELAAVEEKEEGNEQDKALDQELMRKAGRALYRAPDPTRRWVETHYWRRPLHEQDASLIRPNAFWRDYASAIAGARFVSTNIADATGSFAEMLLALAVLDLPFVSEALETTVDGTRVTLGAKTPMLCVRREITAAGAAPRDSAPILVSQNFYRLDDRYRFDGNVRRDAWVTDEFVVGVVYGCQVVVTNPTSTPLQLELLLQIPQGAIEVLGGVATRGVGVALDAYGTQALEYAFYFPAPGEAAHYPVHVSVAGAHLANAPAVTLRVVREPTRIDTTSWEHISQEGSPDEVLRHLESANLFRIDLAKIAWRMRDRQFFEATIERLRRRHVYADRLWSYGLLHRDAAAMREYLRHQAGFLAACGRWLLSPIVVIDPVERRAYEHVEFEPLFNPRAHRFGAQRTILNASLAEQYSALMHTLCYRPDLDDSDWMSVTYYLVLQDRVAEALGTFARVERTSVPGKLQHDYMAAYLDFFDAEHRVARGIAERHRDHPVDRWRKLFSEVTAQLDEADGRAVDAITAEDRTRRMTELADSGPSLELQVEGRRATLRYRNLARCELRFFVMDVEFLFSTHPFVQQGSDAFAYVRPNRSDTVELPGDRSEIVVELPAELSSKNVLVEAVAGGITRRQAHYAHSLDVRWLESYGQVQVTEASTKALLPRVYVKVFAREPGGRVRFHKDGYTDLRGRFDYASLSGEGASNVERYSVLVLSEERGAVIRELDPPAR